mmetsp:Transcript_66555/g.111304  ORF Transcript_66555/g.111304 Transcript_66555/m.111304 type:complete len:89 (-) Transcript_66555:160-426(-)
MACKGSPETAKAAGNRSSRSSAGGTALQPRARAARDVHFTSTLPRVFREKVLPCLRCTSQTSPLSPLPDVHGQEVLFASLSVAYSSPS